MRWIGGCFLTVLNFLKNQPWYKNCGFHEIEILTTFSLSKYPFGNSLLFLWTIVFYGLVNKLMVIYWLMKLPAMSRETQVPIWQSKLCLFEFTKMDSFCDKCMDKVLLHVYHDHFKKKDRWKVTKLSLQKMLWSQICISKWLEFIQKNFSWQKVIPTLQQYK